MGCICFGIIVKFEITITTKSSQKLLKQSILIYDFSWKKALNFFPPRPNLNGTKISTTRKGKQLSHLSLKTRKSWLFEIFYFSLNISWQWKIICSDMMVVWVRTRGTCHVKCNTSHLWWDYLDYQEFIGRIPSKVTIKLNFSLRCYGPRKG